jgi:NADPH:quinone reductase-like Zn-dependent oxidoreductase
MAFNLSYLFDNLHIMSEAFDELYQWFESGALRPLPTQSFELDAVADAQRALESGSTTGKLLLLSNPSATVKPGAAKPGALPERDAAP